VFGYNTSNHIYTEIGYEPACDFRFFTLTRERPSDVKLHLRIDHARIVPLHDHLIEHLAA
jgi:hypothetical protein